MGLRAKDLHFWTRRAAIAGLRGLHNLAPPIRNYSRVRFHMDTVFWHCEAHGFPLHTPRILDPFAGSGINMSHSYLDRAASAHLCDIDPDHARLAGKLGPKVTSIHGDSFRMLNEGDPRLGKYDLIVLDNNLGGVYHDYCEHFDAMPAVFRHFDAQAPYVVLALNFITDPDRMNADERFATPSADQQMAKRAEFYGTSARRITPTVGAAAYAREARKEGWEVIDHALAPRAEFFHFLLLFMRRAAPATA
jgi:hypothetical protein